MLHSLQCFRTVGVAHKMLPDRRVYYFSVKIDHRLLKSDIWDYGSRHLYFFLEVWNTHIWTGWLSPHVSGPASRLESWTYGLHHTDTPTNTCWLHIKQYKSFHQPKKLKHRLVERAANEPKITEGQIICWTVTIKLLQKSTTPHMTEKPSPVTANTFSHFLPPHQSTTERHTVSHTHTQCCENVFAPYWLLLIRSSHLNVSHHQTHSNIRQKVTRSFWF